MKTKNEKVLIDGLDKIILKELVHDARKSINQIAKTAGRSGAAVPEQEFQRYKIMYTPSVFDSDEVAKFKIQSLKKEFAEQVRLLQEGRSIELSNSIKQDKDGNITSLQFLANEFKGQEMNEQTIKELLKKIKKDDDGFTEFKRNE